MTTNRTDRRQIIEQRAGRRCEYCRAPQWIFNSPFHIEHIIPRSRQGADDFDNLALSCSACNFAKSAAIEGPDPETGLIVPLFNPRTQRWDAHFAVSQDGALLIGVTAHRRTTVQVLKMNALRQTEARALWVTLRIFPFASFHRIAIRPISTSSAISPGLPKTPIRHRSPVRL